MIRCGVRGVMFVAVCLWLSFALMLAAGMQAEWMVVEITSTASNQERTQAAIGPFRTCDYSLATTSLVCKYISTSNFNPTDAEMCPDNSGTVLNSCKQAAMSLLAVRVCFIIFLVFQFFAALMCSIVPMRCVRGSKFFTYRKSKFLCGIAELCQIVVVSMWYVVYQHRQNLASYNTSISTSSSTESVRLTSSFAIAVVAVGFPFIASIADCFIQWPTLNDERRRAEEQRERMVAEAELSLPAAVNMTMIEGSAKRSNGSSSGGGGGRAQSPPAYSSSQGIAQGPSEAFPSPSNGQMGNHQPLVYAV